MAQHNEVLHDVRNYTRQDFTALRVWLSGIPAPSILNRYFCCDDVEERFPAGAPDLEKFLAQMRDDLISRLIDANPRTAEALSKFRTNFRWSKIALDYLIQAADTKASRPVLIDPVSAWMKPIAAKRLAEDSIRTLSDLMCTIRLRGKGWYRPIPCLGPGKARRIETWLRSHADTLGALPSFLSDMSDADKSSQIILERFSSALPPIGSFRPANELDGSQGINRHAQFPLISARNDYDALQAYLYKFRGRDKTHSAYRKELERFMLWCVTERGNAMSSLVVDDCEAYKDFLSNIPERWIGTRRARNSQEWRPFADVLSPKSQRYAIQCLRAFFAYLVNVRYLAANPFVAVSDPPTERAIHAIQIEKALPKELWAKLSNKGGILDCICDLSEEAVRKRFRLRHFGAASHATTVEHAVSEQYVPQLRLLRAVVLILGATGIRREELAFATRAKLQPCPDEPGLWRLAVLGKRAKWRYVYLTKREIDALDAHWQDRGEDFSFGIGDIPLVSPIVKPATRYARQKQDVGGRGFSLRGLNHLMQTWRSRIANDSEVDLTSDERNILENVGLHAYRHTNATLALDGGVPLDVVKHELGHASLNTTSLYVRGAEKRAAAEYNAWRKRQGANP
jgi:site-specific recombinase XerD